MTDCINLYCACPVCIHNNQPTSNSHWTHKNCSGGIRIHENLNLSCILCNHAEDIFNWAFLCPNHSGDNRSLKDQGVTSLAVLNALARAIQMNNLSLNERKIYKVIRDALEDRG